MEVYNSQKQYPDETLNMEFLQDFEVKTSYVLLH